jgi:hypothetical protein
MHRIIYAGGVNGQGEEQDNILKGKQAMKEAKELAERITELYKINKKEIKSRKTFDR